MRPCKRRNSSFRAKNTLYIVFFLSSVIRVPKFIRIFASDFISMPQARYTDQNLTSTQQGTAQPALRTFRHDDV